MKTFSVVPNRQCSPQSLQRQATVVTPAHAHHQSHCADIRQILRGSCLQTKLTVGAPDDVYEQEADRVADEVMRMSPSNDATFAQIDPPHHEPSIQRQNREDDEELVQTKLTEGTLQRTADANASPDIEPGIEARIHALQGGGVPLPPAERAFFEPRFGHDFSQVRIHTGPEAAESARAVNAQAFTVGRDVVFGEGDYAPEKESGRRLLAHELTHVVQQRSGACAPAGQVQRALLAPPTRLDVSSIITSIWDVKDVAEMDAEIAILKKQNGADGRPKLGIVEYKLGELQKEGNRFHTVALKASLLSVIQDQAAGEKYADGEYRLRIRMQVEPFQATDPTIKPIPEMSKDEKAFVIVRFDTARNAEVVLTSVESTSIRSINLEEGTISLGELQEALQNTYKITFVSDNVIYKKATHTGKNWSDQDLILIRDALELIGGTEKVLLENSKFRRLSRANFNGIRGFYLGEAGGASINFFDGALPFEKGTWVGENGQEYSYGVHTTLHELGHLLHYSETAVGGVQTEYLDLFKDAVWARSGAPRDNAKFPPPGITLPTTYSRTGEAWKDFFSDTYSIYVTNPSFLDTPPHRYLLDFFRLHFPR